MSLQPAHSHLYFQPHGGRAWCTSLFNRRATICCVMYGRATCSFRSTTLTQPGTSPIINVARTLFPSQQPHPHLPSPRPPSQAEKAHDFITRTFVVLAAQYNAECEIDLVKGACREAIGAAICRKSAALSAAAVVVPGAKRSVWEEIFTGSSVSRHVSAFCKQPTIILH